MEKVEEQKRSGHLNCFFPELSPFNGLGWLCVHSAKQSGCDEADVVKGCVGTPDGCARKHT